MRPFLPALLLASGVAGPSLLGPASATAAPALFATAEAAAAARVPTAAADNAADDPINGSVAAASLTLENAVAEGLHRAPELAEAEAARSEAAYFRQKVRASFLPRLQLSAGHLFVARFYQMTLGSGADATLVALRSPSTEVGAQASLSLFDGMQNVRTLQASSQLQQARDKSLAWQRFVRSREIQVTFYQVLAGQQLERAARQNVDTLMGHLAQITLLRQQGAATDFDILRAQVQLEDAHVQIDQAEDRTALARRRLAQQMGLQDDPRVLLGELPRPDPATTARVQAVAATPSFVRLDFAALQSQEHAHRRLQQAARSFWLPKVELNAALSHYNIDNKRLFRSDAYRSFRTVGVRISMNVFDGLGALAEAGQQQARLQQVRHARHAAELAQGYALVEAKRDYLLAAKQLHARELNVRRAEENVRLARSGLANGSQTSTDVLDAQQDLFAARAGAIEAQLGIAQAAAHLDIALGTAL